MWWGAAEQGGAGEGGSSRDKDETGQYCQMVWVRRARWRGVREEPVLLRPLKAHRLEPGGSGLGAVRTRRGFGWGGKLAGGHVDVRPGGHGEVLRVSRGDAAGIELGSSFAERVAVNTGTVSVLACHRASRAAGWRLGPPSTERSGTGRSRRSSRSPGEPVTGRRAAAVWRRDGCCNAERCTGEYRR